MLLLVTTIMDLGMLLDSSLLKIQTKFPITLLGVSLLISNRELNIVSHKISVKQDSFVIISNRELNIVSHNFSVKQDSFVIFMCTNFYLTRSKETLAFECGIATYVFLNLKNLTCENCIKKFHSSKGKLLETMSQFKGQMWNL